MFEAFITVYKRHNLDRAMSVLIFRFDPFQCTGLQPRDETKGAPHTFRLNNTSTYGMSQDCYRFIA